MKRIFLASLAAVFFTTAQAEAPHVNIEHWQTTNGAEVYFVQSTQIPMVDVQVVFAAGSSRDGEKWGLASFVNAVIDEGTAKHNADAISNSFADVGAEFSQSIDQDAAAVRLRSLTLPEYLTPAVKLFAEVLTQPNFPANAVARMKQQTLASLQMESQSPTNVAAKAFFQLIYDSHPYGHPLDGTAKTVSLFKRTDVQAFYQQYYVGKNASVIIVGDLNRSAAEKIAQQVVGQLSAGHPAPALALATNKDPQAYQYVSFPSNQETIITGQMGIVPGDPNYFPLNVGNQILGGQPLSSILFNEVRSQRGLAYQVVSQITSLKDRGLFYIELQTRTDQAKNALDVVNQTLKNFLDNGPTAAQLESAKKNIIDSFPLELASNANILDNVTMVAFYHLPLDYLNTYTQKVQNVTLDQVKTTFQQLIQANRLKTVVVGSQNPLEVHDQPAAQ